MSSSSERRSPKRLDGRTFFSGAAIYVFLGPAVDPLDVPVDVRQVEFSIDGIVLSTDGAAPFDLVGTRSAGGQAYGFESNLLAPGRHTLTAAITYANSTTATAWSEFTVARTTPHRLLYSTGASRSAAKPLDGRRLSGKVAVFLGARTDAITDLARVDFYLDGVLYRSDSSSPYDFVGGDVRGATMLDATSLSPGPHTITAVVVVGTGARWAYRAAITR